MKNEYFDSLHDIEMSEERKSELIDVLAKEIEANNMTFEDGIPEAAFDQDRALIMRGGSHVWGADGAAGSAHFFDADPSDNTLQYVEQMFVDADDGIVGRTCTVEFDELLSVYAGYDDAADEAREPIVLAEGGWSMRFTIDYEDTTVAFTSGQTVSGDDHNFEIANVNLSPVSITIEYVTDAKADVNSGGYSEQVKLSCPCSIVMDDGAGSTSTSASLPSPRSPSTAARSVGSPRPSAKSSISTTWPTSKSAALSPTSSAKAWLKLRECGPRAKAGP